MQMSMRLVFAVALVLILVFVSPSSQFVRAEKMPAKTALDDYILAADDSYAWKIVKEESAGQLKTVVIDMISQTWRGYDDVDRPVAHNIRLDGTALSAA